MKRKCFNCGKEIEKEFKYCPFCSAKQSKGSLLDDIEDIMEDRKMELGLGGFGIGSLFKNFDKIVQSLSKQIESEMRKMDREIKPVKPHIEKHPEAKGFSIKINLSGEQPRIIVKNIGEEGAKSEMHAHAPKKEIGIKKIKEIEKKSPKLEKLPRQEAKTRIKRLGDRIVYEIELDGVKSADDIEIKQLENSTEIKAIAKDKIYFKLIPIALPIIDYELKKGRLYINFKPEV